MIFLIPLIIPYSNFYFSSVDLLLTAIGIYNGNKGKNVNHMRGSILIVGLDMGAT